MADKRSARNITVMKWLGLAIGCLAKFMSGSLFVFSSYEDALKTTFNFTAKDVQLQSSFLSIGLGVGFLPGMFYDRFGPQWSSGAGLVLSLVSYLLLWSTTKSVSFYSSRSWLMAIYFFLCGLGSLLNYITALNTNAINFHPKHRGKIVGILSASYAGSASVFAALYFHVIGKKDPKSADSFSTLMIVLAVCFVVLDILCIAFLRVCPRIELTDDIKSNLGTNSVCKQSYDKGFESINNSKEVIKSSSIIDDKNASATDLIVPNDNTGNDTTSVLTILTSLDYQLLTWSFTFASTAGIVFMITLTQTSAALGLDNHNAEIVLVIPITNAVISAAIGVITDHFQQTIPRVGIFVVGIAAFVICQTLVVGLGDKYPVLVTASVMNGVGQGIVFSISPVIMSEIFSIKNLGRNWGISMMVFSLVDFAAQEAFGALYDAEISTPGEVYCYGMKCVRGGHAVILGMAVLAMILSVVLFIRRRK